MSEKKKENLEEMFKDLEELIGKMENEEITLEPVSYTHLTLPTIA